MGDVINACLLEVGDVVRFPEQSDDLPPVRLVGMHPDSGKHAYILFHGFTIHPRVGEDEVTEVTWNVYEERQVDRLTDAQVDEAMRVYQARLIQEAAQEALTNAQRRLPG